MVDVIIVANGASTRFGEDKLLAKINNELVILKAIKCFIKTPNLNKIILVTNETIKQHLSHLQIPNLEFTSGGVTRSGSVANGLKLVEAKWVLIHDGARPFVSEKLIKTVLTTLTKAKAVIPILPVTSCLKQKVNGAIKTIDRADFFTTQTPQGFEVSTIKQAYQNFNKDWYDDCQAVEEMGEPITTVLGEKANIKITVKEDLENI